MMRRVLKYVKDGNYGITARIILKRHGTQKGVQKVEGKENGGRRKISFIIHKFVIKIISIW